MLDIARHVHDAVYLDQCYSMYTSWQIYSKEVTYITAYIDICGHGFTLFQFWCFWVFKTNRGDEHWAW